EHLGKGELHLVRKRSKVRGGDLVILVLDQVQEFNQEIAAARLVAEQEFDLMRRGRINLAALRRCLGALAALAGMVEFADFMDVVSHLERLVSQQNLDQV